MQVAGGAAVAAAAAFSLCSIRNAEIVYSVCHVVQQTLLLCLFISRQELQFSVSYVTGINVAGMDLEIRYRDSYLSTCGEGSKQHWWEMALSVS